MPDPNALLEERPILTSKDMLERLTWRLRWLEAARDTPGLDVQTRGSIETRLDALYTEYRRWYEVSELEQHLRQHDTRLGQLLDEIEALWMALEQSL
jgi:hypothetical protein